MLIVVGRLGIETLDQQIIVHQFSHQTLRTRFRYRRLQRKELIMLKITSSRLEHIELAEFCYFIRDAQCRIRVMTSLMEKLKHLTKRASGFKKLTRRNTNMACGKGKKKGGKKGGKK
jgi:hypothetical protein